MIVEQIWTGNAYRNFNYLIVCPDTGEAMAVDPLDHEKCLATAKRNGWTITQILNTHEHNDHIGGNDAVVAATGAKILAHHGAKDKIPDMARGLDAGDVIKVGKSVELECLDTPGHTMSHICMMSRTDQPALFCGDTLFALGCGRMFEGTPTQFWTSLVTLRALPAETRIYCGHEYTQSNARFALSVDGGNPKLKARAAEIDRKRAAGQPTVPSTLADELDTNPFLRADDPAMAAAVGLSGADPVAVFAEIRKRKDTF